MSVTMVQNKLECLSFASFTRSPNAHIVASNNTASYHIKQTRSKWSFKGIIFDLLDTNTLAYFVPS